MRIVVCEAQVPFVEGGAEYHVRELIRQLRLHGHEAELVGVPFKWYPKDEILAHAAAWRFLDLSESNGTRIDLAIGDQGALSAHGRAILGRAKPGDRLPGHFLEDRQLVLWWTFGFLLMD